MDDGITESVTWKRARFHYDATEDDSKDNQIAGQQATIDALNARIKAVENELDEAGTDTQRLSTVIAERNELQQGQDTALACITAALTALSEVEYALVGGNLAGEPIEADVVAGCLKLIREALECDATPAPSNAEVDSPNWLASRAAALQARGHERIDDPRKSESS